MKLFGRLRNGVGIERLAAVIKAPATYNRAARREVGVYGRAWAWDRAALGVPANLPPRYVRRHYRPDLLTTAKTRRERKQKARILRAMKGHGL